MKKATKTKKAREGRIPARMGGAGPEQLDPTPMEIPIGMQQPESFESMVQRFIKTELSEHAANNEQETFEEADDFEEEDPDTLVMSQYQLTQLQEQETTTKVPQEGTSEESAVEASETDESQTAPMDTPHQNNAERDPPEASGVTS